MLFLLITGAPSAEALQLTDKLPRFYRGLAGSNPAEGANFIVATKNSVRPSEGAAEGGWRALTSGGGAGQFSRSKKVRAKCIITAPK